MKAHGMRRSIWFLNAALAVAVLGVAAWYVLDVRDAVASTPRPRRGKAPAKWAKIVKAFNKQIEEARTDVLRAPVRRQGLLDAFKIEDYKKRDPVHFIFTGPLPPPVRADTTEDPKQPPKPTGLDAIGEVAWVIYAGETDGTVVWRFKGEQKELGFFRVGDFVRKDPKNGAQRFRLTRVRIPEPGLYRIEYEVWEDGKPQESDEPLSVTWDKRPPPPGPGGVLRIVPQAKPGGEAEAVATPAPGEPVASEGPKPAGKPAEVVVVGGRTGRELTKKDLKPEIKVVNSRLREVRFDENSARYFRSRDTKKMVESVKTREVSLPGGKRGVMIVDPGEAPADVFDLRRGDVIVKINGRPTPDRASIIRAAESIPETATRVTIVVDRNGRQITFHVDPRDPKARRRAAMYGHGSNG